MAGPIMGFTVPLLLLMGNRSLGVSSSLRHICAAVLPGRVAFLRYDWKAEGGWLLFFSFGLVIGGFLGGWLLANPEPVQVSARTVRDFAALGVSDRTSYLPSDLFRWTALGTLRGLVTIVLGGFLIGFGTRYSGGCTSGHGITGISSLQWTSLVATLAIFAGAILTSYFLLPLALGLPS